MVVSGLSPGETIGASAPPVPVILKLTGSLSSHYPREAQAGKSPRKAWSREFSQERLGTHSHLRVQVSLLLSNGDRRGVPLSKTSIGQGTRH